MTAWEIASIIIIGGLMAILAVVCNYAAHERDRLMRLLSSARRDADAARRETDVARRETDVAIQARQAAEKSELEMSENLAQLRVRRAEDWGEYVFKLRYAEPLDPSFPVALHTALSIAEKAILRRWSERERDERERRYKNTLAEMELWRK